MDRSTTQPSSGRRPTSRTTAYAVLVLTLLLGTIATLTAAPVAASGCRTNWSSIQRMAAGHSSGSITGVRTGRHLCFDRLVIDIDGTVAGYHVDYVDSLTADATGDIVPVDGGATIRVIVRAPAYDDNGRPTANPGVVSATDVTGYRTFRDIEWAGSFEGQTTLGLGVRARLPFRVFTLEGPGRRSRLVIDVAHTWNTPEAVDDGFARRPGAELAVIGVAHDDVLNVRSGPGTNQRIVAHLSPTESVTATGRARALTRSIWYEVTTRAGTTGWVGSRYVATRGPVDDVTATYLAENPRRTAATMSELGALVARDFLPAEPGSFTVMSVAPTVGDLGEVTYDVVGLADESVASLRLHIFAEPGPDGTGFELRTIEAQAFCLRGSDGTECA